MNVYINRKPVVGPWGGGNLLITALYDILPSHGISLCENISSNTDAVLMIDPRPGNTGISINEISAFKHYFSNKKIIHRVNECDARKNTDWMDNLLCECSKITDHTVFVSNWMKEYHFKNGWHCKDSSIIYNGVNSEHFKPRSKINNGKVNIVTHHWANNRMKGFDIYEKIDNFVSNNDNFTFTYIGRELGTFKNTNTVSPLFGKDLGEKLSMYDVYISGSRFDPGPNHILESLACEIPTYVYCDGGGAVEFAGESHVFSSIEELFKILEAKSYVKNNFNIGSWEQCVVEYLEVIKKVTDENNIT